MKQKKLNELTNAPKTNRQLAKEAKLIKKAPRDKYKCKMYFEGIIKSQCEIRNISKSRLKASQVRYKEKYYPRTVIFSEIEAV